MAEAQFKDTERRMAGAIEVLRKEFAGLRTGRASASLLEPVQVEAYGSRVPLNQVGNVNVPEPRMITVQGWDKSLVKAVETAIRDSGLGLNPGSDGQLVRVPIPDRSEERRAGRTKRTEEEAEQARGSGRSARREVLGGDTKRSHQAIKKVG